MASSHLYDIARVEDSDSFDLGIGGESNEVDDGHGEETDIVVAHIKRLARAASLEFALRVGAVIIHHFYDGDTEAWRSRGPKTSSFRRLAQHPELPLSAGSLYRCVAVFELCDRLNAPARWKHLGASHLRLVLGLPPVAQERLLATANAKRWTVKVLQEEAAREKSLRVFCGGRRAELPLTKSLKNVRKCFESHREAIARVEHLSSRDLEESMFILEQARSSLHQLSLSIRAAMMNVDDDEGDNNARVRAISG